MRTRAVVQGQATREPRHSASVRPKQDACRTRVNQGSTAATTVMITIRDSYDVRVWGRTASEPGNAVGSAGHPDPGLVVGSPGPV